MEGFLIDWNGRSFFLDSSSTPTANLELYTDAASSVVFGGFLKVSVKVNFGISLKFLVSANLEFVGCEVHFPKEKF